MIDNENQLYDNVNINREHLNASLAEQISVATGRGRGRHIPPGASRGAESGCSNFLRQEIYKNFVSSVEVGMGMEGQIMCEEQCTFYVDVTSSARF